MIQLTSIEDDLLVGGKLGSNGLPPGFEVGGRGDDIAGTLQL